MTDTASVINETDREIGSKQIAAGQARTAVLRRRYHASIEDVWDACTDPERLARWFMKVTGDLRLGGTFNLEGNASGEIVRCEPARLLAVTWVYGDHPVDEVELRLSPGEEGETVLELEHATVSETTEFEGLAYDAIFGVGTGWDPAVWALDLYLRDELPEDLAERWRSGDFPPEVEEFFSRSAEAWTRVLG